MNRDFGRGQRRPLRQLAALAWERELSSELASLASSFDEWNAGRLGAHELSDRVHEFHHGPARELYGLYTRVHTSQLVARAVGLGVLSETEVPADLLAELAQSIEYYRTEPQPPLDDNDSSAGT